MSSLKILQMRNLFKVLRYPDLKNLNRHLSKDCDPPCPCPPPPAPNPCPKPPSSCPPPRLMPHQGRCDSISALNPCNYCPPPCPEEGYPTEAIKKIKRMQCFYQRNFDVPVFIAKGTRDKFFHNVLLLGFFLSIFNGVYIVYELGKKY